jgi:hypothetical protein
MPIGEEGQHLRLAGAERWVSPLDRRADAGSHPFALLRRSDVLDLTDEVQRQGLHLGGYGNDSIDGGSGTDVRIGGPGADTFSNCETQRERCQPPAGVGAPAEQVDPHPTHDRRRRSSRARSRSTPSAGRRRARVRLPARCTRSGGGHRRGGRARAVVPNGTRLGFMVPARGLDAPGAGSPLRVYDAGSSSYSLSPRPRRRAISKVWCWERVVVACAAR